MKFFPAARLINQRAKHKYFEGRGEIYLKFFEADFFRYNLPFTTRLGSNTLWTGLGCALLCAACTMCVVAAKAKAIGIEMESTKRHGRSEGGLVMESPGRRHCPSHSSHRFKILL